MNRNVPPMRTALMLLALAGAAGAQERAQPPLDESEASLLALSLRGKPLGEDFLGFPAGKSALVPLAEICHLLGFSIEVRAEEGRAAGFFVDPKRRFNLDLKNRSVEAGGRRHSFEAWQVRIHGMELYVDVALLSAWFPLKVEVSFRDSVLRLTPTEELPVEAALRRDADNARLLGRTGDPNAERKGPRYSAPYRAFSLPAVDASLNWNKTMQGAGEAPSATFGLGGDLLWMSSNFYFMRSSSGSFRGSRGLLFREDQDGGLLGPLHARHVSIGDIQNAGTLELAGGLPQGKGLSIDNYGSSFRSSFGTRAFRGLIPPGWTVELFQNDGLVGYQAASPSGTYEFPEVKLGFGLNLYRLVFHGPQGQKREETYRIDISQDQPEPGSVRYRFSALQPTDTMMAAVPDAGPPPLPKSPSVLAEVDLGLTNFLSAKAGVTRHQFRDGVRDVGVAGFRTMFPYLSVDAFGAMDRRSQSIGESKPGAAAMALLRTGLGYSNLSVSRVEYRRGFGTVFSGDPKMMGRQLKTQNMASLATSIPIGPSSAGVSYTFQDDTYLEGKRRIQRYSLMLSAFGVALSPSYSVVEERFGDNRNEQRQWGLVFSGSAFGAPLQGQVDGTHANGRFEVNQWSIQSFKRLDSGFSMQGGLRGAGSNLRGTSAFFSGLQQTGRFSYGIDASYAQGGGYTIGIRLQASVGREPRTGKWYMDAQQLSGSGALSARAFLDLNSNGTLDEGERTLEDVKFQVGNSTSDEKRISPQVALYTNLGRGQDVQVAVDTSTLEDTSQQPAVPSYTIRPRPGTVLQVDYPIVILGEVNGTCRLKRPGRTMDFPGLMIELAQPSGEPFRSQRTAYDGFFEFRDLPPGEYLLRIPEKEVERLKLKPSPVRKITVTIAKSLFEGQDLVLEYLEDPLAFLAPSGEKGPDVKKEDPEGASPNSAKPDDVKPELGTAEKDKAGTLQKGAVESSASSVGPPKRSGIPPHNIAEELRRSPSLFGNESGSSPSGTAPAPGAQRDASLVPHLGSGRGGELPAPEKVPAVAPYSKVKNDSTESGSVRGKASSVVVNKKIWTISMLVAYREDTVSNALLHAKDIAPVFVQKITINGEKVQMRVCFGRFNDFESAGAAMNRVPSWFFRGKNRPYIALLK